MIELSGIITVSIIIFALILIDKNTMFATGATLLILGVIGSYFFGQTELFTTLFYSGGLGLFISGKVRI